MNDLNKFDLERRSLKEKLDKQEISAEEALKGLNDIEQREIAFKKMESEKAVTDTAQKAVDAITEKAKEIEQRMMSINIQASPKKETRLIEQIKTAYTERRDITIGLPELGRYDVVQEVFSEIKKNTPLISMARSYSVPTASMVFPIISALSGISTPNIAVNYNDPKSKTAKATPNQNETMPVNGKSTITLTTKMIQPKLNVGWVPISWEALNQGAIRSDDQLVPAFTDAFAQIIEAGVMSGGSGFAGITQETAAQNFVATADTAASHWEQLVLMATSIATYVPYGASIIMSAGEKSFLINEGIGVSGGHFLAQELARSNSILGVPVIVEPNMTWSAANGIKAYAYPMSDYGIVYVNSMELVWKEGPAGDTSKVLEARYAFGGAPVVGGANLFTMTQTV